MNKREFLEQLKKELSGLPQSDIEDRLTFYGEMIDDRTEEGMTESEAVSGVGTVKEVAAQILSDIPLGKLVKEKVKPNRTLKAWEIVLLILGSPVCLSLLISACAVIIAVYAAIWSVGRRTYRLRRDRSARRYQPCSLPLREMGSRVLSCSPQCFSLRGCRSFFSSDAAPRQRESLRLPGRSLSVSRRCSSERRKYSE